MLTTTLDFWSEDKGCSFIGYAKNSSEKGIGKDGGVVGGEIADRRAKELKKSKVSLPFQSIPFYAKLNTVDSGRSLWMITALFYLFTIS